MKLEGATKAFGRLLINVLFAGVSSMFLWFAVTFWVYLETKSVLATSIIGGSFLILSSLFGLVFGTFVDRHRKKYVMVIANLIALVAFLLAAALFLLVDETILLQLGRPCFWIFVTLILAGAVIGDMRMIALSTCVTLLLPEHEHRRANGKVGTVNGER